MMRRPWLPALLGGALLSLAPLAHATGPDEVAVRARKYTLDDKVELSGGVGFSLVDHLIRHTDISGGLAYNFAEPYAVMLLGGYAISDQTDTARNLGLAGETGRDLADLWQLAWNGAVAFRWSPLYGKLNLAAEIPIHFKAFLLAGAGLCGVFRDNLADATAAREHAVRPMGVAGGGLSFFAGSQIALNLEVRDLFFPDSYVTGDSKRVRSLTHVPFALIGASYSF